MRALSPLYVSIASQPVWFSKAQGPSEIASLLFQPHLELLPQMDLLFQQHLSTCFSSFSLKMKLSHEPEKTGHPCFCL